MTHRRSVALGEHLRYPKVGDLDDLLCPVEENVLGLEVAVEDLLGVDMLYGEEQLREVLEYLHLLYQLRRELDELEQRASCSREQAHNEAVYNRVDAAAYRLQSYSCAREVQFTAKK